MRRENYPIYQEAVRSYLACDNRRFSTLTESEDLSNFEKILLSVRKCFSKGHFNEALSLLETLTDNSCDFLCAEKYLLFATANSNLGLAENSFLFNGRAIALYQKAQDQQGEFLSTYNLSVDAEKLGLKKISQEYFKKASKLAVSVNQKFLISRARACQLAQELKYREAYHEIKASIEEAHQCDNALDVLTLKTVAVDIFFKAGEHEAMLLLLEDIKDERLLKPKARMFFNLSALKFLKGQPLGIMPKHVRESSEFSLKWSILAALDSGDLTNGKFLWNKLQAAFPGIFAEEFTCLLPEERDGVFYQCILAIESKVSRIPDVRFEEGSKMHQLHQILLSTKIPLRKEELIELVWKKPYDASYDQRFYKLVQRMKDLNLPVVNDRRTYYYSCG